MPARLGHKHEKAEDFFHAASREKHLAKQLVAYRGLPESLLTRLRESKAISIHWYSYIIRHRLLHVLVLGRLVQRARRTGCRVNSAISITAPLMRSGTFQCDSAETVTPFAEELTYGCYFSAWPGIALSLGWPVRSRALWQSIATHCLRKRGFGNVSP